MYITANEVLLVDGGEAYLKSLLPDIYESFNDTRRKFKLREDEKTPSCHLFKHKKEGFWMIKDHGDSNKAMNAIGVKMFLSDCGFGEAIKDAAAFYKLTIKESDEPSATYDHRVPKPNEQPGQYDFELKEIELFELKTIFSQHTWEAMGKTDEVRKKAALGICQYYRLKAVKWYSKVNDEGTKVNIFASNATFPIFLFDEGSWKKIYKPKDKKDFRFLSFGEKPIDYIHGLDQHKSKLAEINEANTAEYNRLKENGNENAKLKVDTLPEIMLCSGGSDALNVAALGYNVIWMNSESGILSVKDYDTIIRLTDFFYNLPDIDATGIREAKKLALRFLEVRTIWLPDELRLHKDERGNMMKDFRDYMKRHRKFDFKGLVETAYPYRFWDEELMLDSKGIPKMKFGRKQISYQFNNTYGYNFLNQMGFWRMANEKEKDGYVFIKVDGNIVRRVEANDIKNFIHEFLENYTMPNGTRIKEDLRNNIYRSPQLAESSLSNLKLFTPNFRYYGIDYQYFFFEDETWEITADKIEKVKMPEVHVHETKVYKLLTTDKKTGEKKKNKIKLLPPLFKINKHAFGWDVEIVEKNSSALNFLVQTCKLHWRAETEDRLNFWAMDTKAQEDYIEKHGLDVDDLKKLKSYQDKEKTTQYLEKTRFALDGELLFGEEEQDQKLAFINRVYVLGYMLHRFKKLENPWAVFAMDYRISDEGQSNGGAGKGLVAKMLYKCLKWISLDGRNEKLLDNPHVFENIDKDTDIVHIEDMSEYFPFKSLFTPLTSSITVNPKNRKSVMFSYDEFGKFWIDTNFGDRNTDQSSKRRKIYTVFSDYYHEDLEFYKEVRTPLTELGGSFFESWDAEQWVMFYNLMAQCLQFFLSTTEKIEPPTTNLNKRNLMSTMGDNFRAWADVYLSPESNRLDDYMQKIPAMNDFIAESKLKISPQLFYKKMEAWCKFNRYELNPKDIMGDKDRIIKTVEIIERDGSRRTTTAEMLYIKTPKPKAVEKDGMLF